MPTLPNTWLLEEVADAQLEVAKKALRKPGVVALYRHFLEAMAWIQPGQWSLLDAGCGTSGYGLLCQAHYPQLRYTGTDISEHMVRLAHEVFPGGEFRVQEFSENDFGAYDIVLASGVLEYAGTWRALGKVLESCKRYVILHRLRGTDGPSQSLREPTYCGHTEDFYLWNWDELRAFIGKYARLEHEIIWDDNRQMTLVVCK